MEVRVREEGREGARTYARSQRLAEKRRWIARSSSSEVWVRYELIMVPIVVVRSGRKR